MPPSKRVAVLGAGLSGLATAYRLSRQPGLQIDVIERDSMVGGLAKSLVSRGFTVDLGPHRFFTENENIFREFDGLMQGNYASRERKSRIYMRGQFFSWPLIMSEALKAMPLAKTVKIGGDYLLARLRYYMLHPEDKSYEDWIVHRFGREIFNLFFRDYNAKLWGLPPAQISKDWAAQRITLKGLGDTVIQSIFKSKPQARTNAAKFYYPVEGGIGRLGQTLAQRIIANGGRVILNREVRGIRMIGDKLTEIHSRDQVTGQTATARYGQVFSTLPLTKMVEFMGPAADAEVRRAAHNLRFKSAIFVYCTINRPQITSDHWIYLPQAELSSNRISEARNFSARNVLPGKTILCGEITCDAGDKTWQISAAELQQKFLDDLLLLEVVSPPEVAETFVHREEFVYPVYDIPYAANRKKVVDFFKGFENLHLLGRNGLFRYNNMDHCLEMGFGAAEKYLGGSGEYERVATEDKFFG